MKTGKPIPAKRKWEFFNMSLKNKQKIVLIRAKPKNAINFFSTKTSNGFKSWIYLGKNVILFSEIEKVIGGRIERIDTGEILQDVARTLRKPFIDFIGSLALRENKISWILTSVSEKNQLISDLFINFCYLETLDQTIKQYPGDICVFCEEPALIRVIRKNYENYAHLEIQCINPIATTIQELIQKEFTLHKNQVLFVICYFLRISCARILHFLKISGQNIQKNIPIIAIHTWIDKRSFLSIDPYSDAYFGNLGHLLEMNNKDFFYIFNMLTTTEFPRILINLSKVKIPWKLFEDFLEFSDIIRAFYMAERRKKEEKTNAFFSGREVSDLLNAGYAQDRYNLRPELSSLYYFAAKNMTRQFSIKSFVYTFENHNWEKMALEGLREDSPQTNIVGYAHSTVNQMYLPYSISLYEKDLLPLPDIILVNGQRAKETLVESGFDENKIVVIGAMRYGVLTSDEFPQLENNKTVLVILSGDINTSLEMIHKSVQAFGKMDGVRILIKPHPIVYSRIFQQYIKNFPPFFTITLASLTDLKKTINLAIYSDSTAAVEVAAQKIPLIHMKSDFIIDANVFEFTNKVPSISSPEMIHKMAFDILFNGLNKNQSLNDEINELFAKVNEIEILSKI